MTAPNLVDDERMGWGAQIGFTFAAIVTLAVPVGSLAAAWLSPRNGWDGIPFSAWAILLAGLNWWLAFRPAVYQWRCGSLDGYQHSSGVPLVGNLFAVLGAAIGWGDCWAAVPSALAVVADPGGFPWFLIVMVRTRQI